MTGDITYRATQEDDDTLTIWHDAKPSEAWISSDHWVPVRQ